MKTNLSSAPRADAPDAELAGRVAAAKAMRYLAGGYALDVESVLGSGVFAAEGEGAVVVRDIEFHSLCEHQRRVPCAARMKKLFR